MEQRRQKLPPGCRGVNIHISTSASVQPEYQQVRSIASFFGTRGLLRRPPTLHLYHKHFSRHFQRATAWRIKAATPDAFQNKNRIPLSSATLFQITARLCCHVCKFLYKGAVDVLSSYWFSVTSNVFTYDSDIKVKILSTLNSRTALSISEFEQSVIVTYKFRMIQFAA